MGAERHSTADRTWSPDSPAARSFSVLMIYFFRPSPWNDLYIGDI
jgi:hypothetical protein